MRLFIFCLLMVSHAKGEKQSYPALIPMPQKVSWGENEFRLNTEVYFKSDCAVGNFTTQQVVDLLQNAGTKILYGEAKPNSLRIDIQINGRIPEVPDNQSEGYRLEITPTQILLVGALPAGVFRGVQTLRQLVVATKGRSHLPCCTITDWPAFSIRGFMQDVGRNYMSLPLLKEQIEVMSQYKLNLFHIHLTDNPGWRLESLKYPQLAAPETMTRKPGLVYSQSDFQELAAYCRDRFITIVPEFDVPGHCAAFRKAFRIDSMSDPRVKPILLDLIDELCTLVPASQMPYVHLGTDEVWHKHEHPEPDLIQTLMQRVRDNGREVFVWRPGIDVLNDSTSIKQLWSSNGFPKPGHPAIDSRLNYINHLDPLNGVSMLYFDRINSVSTGDAMNMGGILCCWNDNNLANERDVLLQNPVYPSMVVYSETTWTGNTPATGHHYIASLPAPETDEYLKFTDFEERLCEHRDNYFRDKPFPYVANAHIPWKLIGPFDHQGDVDRVFPVESSLLPVYQVDGKSYRWRGKPVFGGTIHINHFFGFPSPVTEKQGTVYATTLMYSVKNQKVKFWIGFNGFSRSGGRRGGPAPQQGEWFHTHPKLWVNGMEIAPPQWQQPGIKADSEELPFMDEDYFYRQPLEIELKKGWNPILVKMPQKAPSWKWMFTFVPVVTNGVNVREVENLIFKVPQNL
jgi:hypothetical protein